jgi:Fic-DOC domain mobile mystery protein B
VTPWQLIPGETPIDDLSGLRVKGLKLRRQVSELEAANILKVVEKYFLGRLTASKARFDDFLWARDLHKEMFGDVWVWAGEWRTSQTNIGVACMHIETQMVGMLKDMPHWSNESWPMRAAMLHHRAVWIHPFTNGNGRWSRMLANIWLRLNGQPYTAWPEESVGEVSPIRDEYLEAVRAADKNNHSPLAALHERYAKR